MKNSKLSTLAALALVALIAGLAADSAIKGTVIRTAQASYSPIMDSPILAQLSALPMSTDTMIHVDASGNLLETPASSYGISLVGTPDPASARSLLGISSMGSVTSVGLSSSDFTVSGSPVTSSGSITANLANSGVSAGSYSAFTVNAKGIVTAGANRSFSGATTPALNSAAQLSATRDTDVSYYVDVSISSLLLGTASGTSSLQYADNAGMTANLVTFATCTQSTGGVLNITNVSTCTLAGTVPAGKYRRILTATNSGTVTFTSRPGQETSL